MVAEISVGDAFAAGRVFGVVLTVNEERGIALVSLESGRQQCELALAGIPRLIRTLEAISLAAEDLSHVSQSQKG